MIVSDPNPTTWCARQVVRREAAAEAAAAVSLNTVWLVIDNPTAGQTDPEFPLADCTRTLQVNSLRRPKGSGGASVTPSVMLHTDVPLKRWDCVTNDAGQLDEILVRVSIGARNQEYDLLAPFNGMRQVLRPVRLSGDLRLAPIEGGPGMRVVLDDESGDVLIVDGRYTVNSPDGLLRLPRIRMRLSPKAAAKVTSDGTSLAAIAADPYQQIRWSHRPGHFYPDFHAEEEVHALLGVVDRLGMPALHQAAPLGMPDADLSMRYIGRAARVANGTFAVAHLMADRTSNDPIDLNPMVVMTSPAECAAILVEDWDDRNKCGFIRIPVV